jgi:hypothetical protein
MLSTIYSYSSWMNHKDERVFNMTSDKRVDQAMPDALVEWIENGSVPSPIVAKARAEKVLT